MMFEYNSKHHGLVLINAFNIGTFRFESILEMLQDPALHTEALDEIQMLTFACFGKAEKVLDTACFGFRNISEQQREPLQAYIDLFGEAATVLECIAYIEHRQSLGYSKNPATIRHIVEIAREVFFTWPTAEGDQDETASASVIAFAAASGSCVQVKDAPSAQSQGQSCESPNGSTSLSVVEKASSTSTLSGASSDDLSPSTKRPRVTVEDDDEAVEKRLRYDPSQKSDGDTGKIGSSAPEPNGRGTVGVCDPVLKPTTEPSPAELPPCERFDPSNNPNSRFGLSSPLAFRERDPSTAAGLRFSFVGRVLPPFHYMSKTYKEMKLQLSQDTYFTVMIRNDSMMYYSAQHESLANPMILMAVRNVTRGRRGDSLLFDGQSSLEPIGREYTVEQVFEFNDAYDREFRT
ncbi:hypothetical protein PHBOTO_001545 [Pseudozyma hubeiensis]|nr:hypothetical protein PHBOTO_001545 [Pseudozyma hubeiensis]